MPLRHVTRTPEGIHLESDRGHTLLTPYSPSCIRIRHRLDPAFASRESLLVVAPPTPDVPIDVAEEATAVRLSIPRLTIEIDRQTMAFSYYDAEGHLLTREPRRGGKTLAPIDVEIPIYDREAPVDIEEGADGIRAHAARQIGSVTRKAYQARLEFEWMPGEALYGLGSHEEGMFNLRGHHQYLYQHNMKVAIPVLLSTRGYGILWDSASLMTFHDDAFGSYVWTDVATELDYYVIYGPEFDAIVREIRRLTGKAALLPRWAFGYVQSKERYTCQDELIEVVREYRRRELPLDCIVLDWKSWPGKLWGQKTLDPERFPDPRHMIETLHELHARLMISIWPTMAPGGPDWEEMHERGFLLGNQMTYDAFNPEARDLYWRQAERGLFRHGIDAWWSDATEPFEADWRGEVKPEPEQRLCINVGAAKRYLDPELINAYSLVHAQGIYEGQRSVTSEKRVLNLTRSAMIGQQRYGTVTWSGDVTATWETLRRQIPAGLNFCATGLPYWTTDIGGFFVKSRPDLWFWRGDFDRGVDDPGYRELYVRWFQYATFLPMFRSHGTDTPREIWRFGEPGDPEYDALVFFLRLRYRLLPYIYTLAGWTTHRDYTMLRALPFDFRHDPNTYDVDDQFMFGPAIMVCPVTEPMYYLPGGQPIECSTQTRRVYLPAGCDWIDFWSGERLSGGQHIVADAPLARIPIYVRAGSIIPMAPSIAHADQVATCPLEIHIYSGQDGTFTLYEDEGDGYNYEHGAFSMVSLTWEDRRHRLIVGDRQGAYPGMPSAREMQLILGGIDRPVVETLRYEGQRIETILGAPGVER